MAPPRTPPTDQFNEDIYIKVDKYTKEHEELSERIKSLEDSLGTHQKIANTILSASKTQVDIKTTIKDSLVDLLKVDGDIKREVKKVVDDTDRDAVKVFLSRIGFGVWSIAIIVITAFVTLWINSSK